MKIKTLLQNCETVQASTNGGPYHPTRPHTAENTFLWLRIKAAGRVLSGRADSVEWGEEA